MARFSLLVCSEYPVALGLADRFLVSQQVGDYRPATLSIGAVSTCGDCRSAIRYRSYSGARAADARVLLFFDKFRQGCALVAEHGLP